MRTMLFLGVAVAGLAGCGARTVGLDRTDPGADTGGDDVLVDTHLVTFDSGTRDTAVIRDTATVDTGPDTGLSCMVPLAPDFACRAPKAKKGSTVCTDVAIQAMVDGCFGSGASSGKCSAARSKYGACGKCVLGDWIDSTTGTIDFGACMLIIDSKSSCATDVTCAGDCFAQVCGDCDWASGDYEQCQTLAADKGGACEKYYYKGYVDCFGDPKFSACAVRDIADLLPFYRGACRDGGDWSKMFDPDPVDGGVTDGGSAEAGSTDAAPGG